MHAHISKHVDVFGRLTQLEEFVEEFEHFGDERGAHSLTGDGQQKTGQVWKTNNYAHLNNLQIHSSSLQARWRGGG